MSETETNVVAFRRDHAALGYAPGVVPFDVGNPAHVQAWNTMFALGWSELRFQEKARREGRRSDLSLVRS